jgi:hypothetical protein
MLAIGVLGAAALFALDRALEQAPAARVAPMVFTQPAFGCVLEFLRTGHRPGLGVRIGLPVARRPRPSVPVNLFEESLGCPREARHDDADTSPPAR